MSQNLSRRLLNKRVLQPNFNHLVNDQREPVKKKVSCAPVKQMKTTLGAFAPPRVETVFSVCCCRPLRTKQEERGDG